MLNIVIGIFFCFLIVLFYVLVFYIKERIRSRAWRKEFLSSDTDRQC